MSLSDADKAKIRTGMCPWCERGPFKMVLLHITLAHGTDRHAVRDMLGVAIGVSLVDPSTAASMSTATRARWESGELRIDKHRGLGIPKRRSVAFDRAQASKLTTKEVSCAVCGGCTQAVGRSKQRAFTCSSACAAKMQSATKADLFGSGKLRSPNRKLGTETIVEIRNSYANGSASQSQLAALYQLTQCTIGAIVKGKTYRDVGGTVSEPLTRSESANRRWERLKRDPHKGSL